MGIGRALAVAWAARGATVVLSARGDDALGEVGSEIAAKGGRAITLAGDVTNDVYLEELVSRAVREAGGIDVLVNNAGRGYYAPALKIDLALIRAVFELNVFAPLRLTQLAAPHLEQSRGTVVMMSSVAGVVAAPRYGAYAASKFALEALSMAMRAELATHGVRVVVVRPGPVDTPFRKNATKAEGTSGYSAPDPRAQSAEEVAYRVVRAVERHRSVVETSAFVRVASAASRFAPGTLRMMMRHMAKGDG